VHLGISPILPDQGVIEWSEDLAQLFASLKDEAVTEMFIEVGAFIAMYFTAKGISLLGRAAQPWLIPVAGMMMLIKFLAQIALLFRDWNDKVQMLAAGIVNTVLALLAYFRIDVLVLFIESVIVGMSLSAASAMRVIGQKIRIAIDAVDEAFSVLRDWIDITEFVGDVVLAALSWARFFQL
jgi:hypothetical protein